MSASGLSVVVPQSLDRVRVDKAVALIGDCSRSSVDHLIAAGTVTVDGGRVRNRSTLLRAGQLLEVASFLGAPETGLEADPSVEVSVVYEDDDVIVVDKQAGLVVHPGAGNRTGTMIQGLLARYPDLAALTGAVGSDPDRPGIVHRLDRGTSGLLVIARSPEAYASLVAQLTERSVVRHYRALVLGSIDEESGVVDAPIGRSQTVPTRMAVTRRGKEARTIYHVDGRFAHPGPASLLTATLETGRTHQIRVHLAAIGHPLVGDETYSRGRRLPGTTVGRPFLHATILIFRHPRTGSELSWTSPLPADLERELARLT